MGSPRIEVDDRVVDSVGECWEEHGKPLLLSQLGALIVNARSQ